MSNQPFSDEEIRILGQLEEKRREENRKLKSALKSAMVKKIDLIKEVDIPKTTFFYKLRTNTFTAEEINKINGLISI